MKHTNWFTIRRVCRTVYAIAEFGHDEKVVSYLLVGDRKALLIDTGMGYQDIRSVVSSLTQKPVSVLLTHSHWDHVGGAHAFTDVRVFHEPWELGQLSKQHVGVTKTLQDRDIIHCAPFALQVIHTPGHTPGSVCYVDKQFDLLFSGDTVYPGPLYAHLPESNIFSYQTSIEKLAMLVTAKTKVFPGHNAMSCTSSLITAIKHGFEQVRLTKGQPYTGKQFSIRTLKESGQS